MGQSADELKQDIAQTRGDLTETLDAIGDRVMPGRVIERRKNRVVQSVQSVRDRVMGSVSDTAGSIGDGAGSAVDTVKGAPDSMRQQAQGSPVAAGAIAFGVGFLVAAVFPPSRTEQQAAQGLLDKAEPLKDELATTGRDVAEQVKDVAQDAIDEVKSTAVDSTAVVGDTVRESVQATTSTARDATDAVREQASS